MATEPADDVTVLSPFDVTATKESGYVVTTAVTATKIGTAIIDTPINIQVIDSQFLTDTGVTNFMNAFHYTSGVFVNDEGDFRPQGSISLRGFQPQTIYRNGFPEYYNFSTDAIESIEVVKGPSAVYFGREDPGGIINYNTKEPQFINQSSITFTGGDDAFYKGLADVQAVSKNNKLALRVVASDTKSGSFLDLATEKSDFALIAATWRPSSRFELKMDFEHYEVYQKGTGATGLVDNQNWVNTETAVIAAGGTPQTLGQWQVAQFNATGVLPAAYTQHWYPHGYDFNKNGDGSFNQGRTNIGDIVANWEILPKLNLHVSFNHVVTSVDQANFLNGDPGQLPYGAIKTNVGATSSDFAPNGPIIPADNSVTSLNYGFLIAQWSMVFDRPTLPYLRNEQINTNVRNSEQADLSYEIDAFHAKHTFVASINYSDDEYVRPFMLLNAAAFPASGIIPGWGFTFTGNSSPFSQWISPFQVGFGTPSNGWDPIDLRTLKYSQIPNLKSLDYKLSTELGDKSFWGGNQTFDKDYAGSYQGSYFDGKVHVLLGVRDNIYDQVQTNGGGYKGTYNVATATTFQGGFTVQLTPGLVAYAGGSQSFVPQGTVNPTIKDSTGKIISNGGFLAPERGKGFDFGLKTDYNHSKLNGSMSIFDVDRYDIVEGNSSLQNQLTKAGDSFSGGTDGNLYQNSGLDRTQGVEVDLVYTPVHNDQIVFDYSYFWTRAIITDAPGNINVAHGGTFVPSAIDGTPLPGDTHDANRHNLAEVPPTLAGIWNKYLFPDGILHGLTIGLGVNYQSSCWAMQDAINWTIKNPDVFLVDGLLGYDTSVMRIPLRLALNVNNLLDRHYANSGVGVGQPLTWKASITAKF